MRGCVHRLGKMGGLQQGSLRSPEGFPKSLRGPQRDPGSRGTDARGFGALLEVLSKLAQETRKHVRDGLKDTDTPEVKARKSVA